MRLSKTLMLVGALALSSVTPAAGNGEVTAAAGWMEQKLGDTLPAEAAFVDETGRNVQWKSYLGSEPLILVFTYFKCPHLCTLVLNGLVEVIKKVPLKLGEDYQIIAISIDPKEKPDLALMKQRTYLAQLGIAEPRRWHFLTGTEENIRAMTSAAGFHYKWDPRSGDYAHPAGLVIVTPQGKISHYFSGIEFPERGLKSALIEASHLKIGSAIDRVFLSCFHYDPVTGRYSPKILGILRLAGIATAVGVMSGLLLLSRSSRRKESRR